MTRAVIACGLCLFCLGGALALLFEQGYRLNLTPSMPKGIYRLVGSTERLNRGDLVSFCLSGPLAAWATERGYLGCGSCQDGSKPLFKVLAGLPGDEVNFGPDGIWVNGQLQPVSQAQAFDRKHRSMPAARDLVPGRIPDGLALVLSDRHSGGFDGRYFGLVPLSELRGVEAVKIFTPKREEGKTRE